MRILFTFLLFQLCAAVVYKNELQLMSGKVKDRMVGNVTLLNEDDISYILKLSVGTPTMYIYVSLDFGHSDLITSYHSEDSSTYVPLFNDTGNDRVCLGTVCYENQTLTNYVKEYSSGGTLGMCWPALSKIAATPFMFNIVSELDQPVFAIWLNDSGNYNLDDNNGRLTMGAVDQENCNSLIQYVPLSSQTYWQFTTTSFAFGNYSTTAKYQTASMMNMATTALPLDLFNKVVAEVGATFDNSTNTYIVDCSRISQFPDLVFTIGGYQYLIPSTRYVRNKQNLGVCTLSLSAVKNSGFGPQIHLGVQFAQTYCQVFDMGRGRIGFSAAIH